jgi:circadian clock protein KaiB
MTDDRYLYGAASGDAGTEEILDGNACSPVPEIDLDAFLGHMSELAGEARRRVAFGGRQIPPRAATARDRRKPPAEPKVELVLYTSRESDKSQRAIRAIEAVLDQYDRSQVRLTMCDLSARPEEGEADSVVFTPTLVKQGPGPRTAIIGNLDGGEVLRDLLDASGVDRRWDD